MKGTYENADSAKVLSRINTIRMEAFREGITDSYVPIKWSADLEWMAQIRAAEATVCESHTRPNGTICFSITKNGTQSMGETLAWNWSGMMAGIEQWYGEKYDLTHHTGGETGHYLALINPDYQYIGVGCFNNEGGSWTAVAAEFCDNSKNLNTGRSGMSGSCLQIIEVPRASMGEPEIQGAHSLTEGSTTNLLFYIPITVSGTSSKVFPLGSISYSSSNPSSVSVTAKGIVTAQKPGTAEITAIASSGERKSITITVTPPAIGTRLSYGKDIYRVTKVGKEVEYLKFNKKNRSAVVPATITINGTRYNVTRIASKAFKGTFKKVVIKVPASKLKFYIKFLYKKGVNKLGRIRK